MTAVFGMSMAVLLAVGFPMFAAMTGSVALALAAKGSIPLSIVAQRMFGGLDKFALMSIPFFILAANLMSEGGIARRIIRLANALVGPLPGGLAITAVVACMFFAAISGSSPATVVAIGTLMYPALLEAGYDRCFALGLLTAAGSIGIIIPPSITAIVYGAVTGTSVGALFMAGVGPGVVVGLGYAVWAWLYGRRRGLRAGAVGRGELRAAVREAAWGIGVPVVILGGIYGGVFTPTEASAVAVVYALAVSRWVYRELDWADIWRISVSSALTSAQVMVLLAAAGVLSWYFSIERIAAAITQAVVGLGSSPAMVLLMINVAVLLAGMFLDGASIISILGPLLYPVALRLGIDPVHLGVVLTVNSAIGMFTPPFGLNLFVAVGMAQVPFVEVVRGALPYIAVALVTLVVVTYLPQLSLWLPGLLYGLR